MKYSADKAQNIRNVELIIFIVGWMAILAIPFFNYRHNNSVDWTKVTGEWVRLFSFLILFAINVFVLVPKFLFQKRYLFYIGSTLLVILIINAVYLIWGFIITPAKPLMMPPMDLGPGMPPMELGNGMPAPIGYRPASPPEQKSIFMVLADNLIISILIIGAGTSIKMVSQWLNEEGRRKDLEKEQLKTELAFLRHQVSPHFFMNTLNNIHALIDINAEDAKSAIIELSTLMRYLLYDTAHGHTTLKKEIHFIESYIALMQLRFPQKVTVLLDVPENIPDIQIPPMLFISFLENAFKHGVSFQNESYVSFKLSLTDGRLNCIFKNSKVNSVHGIDKSYSGIGLNNIKQSLKLLYGDDFLLNIPENDADFEVQLSIPVYENKMSVN